MTKSSKYIGASDYLVSKEPIRKKGFNSMPAKSSLRDRVSRSFSEWMYAGGLNRRQIPNAHVASLITHITDFIQKELEKSKENA